MQTACGTEKRSVSRRYPTYCEISTATNRVDIRKLKKNTKLEYRNSKQILRILIPFHRKNLTQLEDPELLSSIRVLFKQGLIEIQYLERALAGKEFYYLPNRIGAAPE
jgi:hypothetical protein